MEKSMLVKGLTPRLPERGKIKIGIKGQWIESKEGNSFQPPKKLDHFIITKTVRGEDKLANFVEDTALMTLLKGEYADPDGKLRRIPIRLLFNDIGLNVQTRYAAYKGRKTLLCSGDGKSATKNDGKGGFTEVECPCKHKDPVYQAEHPKETKCKLTTRFQCEIVGCEEVGGVFIFRSTSYNIGVELPSSIAYIDTLTTGVLIGLDLTLVIGPRTTEKGIIHVVTVIYKGSRTDLKEAAIKLLESDTVYSKRHELVEIRARKMLVSTNELQEYLGDNAEDITAEHYPEEAEKDVPDEIPTIKDSVDTGTGEVFEEEEKPKPTKAQLTEQYFNDNFADLCTKKPFGGLKFSDLKKKDKDWVYAQMTAEQEPEQVEQEEVIEPENVHTEEVLEKEEPAKTLPPAKEVPGLDEDETSYRLNSVIEEKKTKTKSKTKEPEKGFIEIPGTGKDNGWG